MANRESSATAILYQNRDRRTATVIFALILDKLFQMAVKILLRIFKVIPVDADILGLAVDFHDKDFEDDIQLQCALKAKCSQLFTRNPNHYDHSAIAVVPPSSFTVD